MLRYQEVNSMSCEIKIHFAPEQAFLNNWAETPRQF
jgi:hypothetical protein